MWIDRDISHSLLKNRDLVQVFRGPRQCGKSSLILRLDPEFRELSLDDPSLRELAQNDPELFLKQFLQEKLFIDEVQYAPNLFPSLKRRVDLYKRSGEPSKTIIRLTGSNQILMDQNVKESLAGRASYFDMNTLAVREILRARDIPVQEILYQGGWPEVHANSEKEVKKYLDDYINTYVEKDVVLTAGIQKAPEFLKFTRLLAGRVGQLLDQSGIGIEVGVDSKTIRSWVSILEKMHIISLVPPYFSNYSSRLIKTPKVFFIDSGIACRLQGWTSSAPILTSPQQGHLFENLVFSEIYKLNLNYQMGWQIFHWRSRDGEEVDFLIQLAPNDFLFVECKVSRTREADLSSYPEVRKVFRKEIPQGILCHQEGSAILGSSVPIAMLGDFLLKRTT